MKERLFDFNRQDKPAIVEDSNKERLPEELESVLVGTNYEGRYYYEVAFVMNGKWVCHNSKPIYWMPIPSFDDILEANRDVLERIKEKGD